MFCKEKEKTCMRRRFHISRMDPFTEWMALFQALWDRNQEAVHFAQIRGGKAAN